VSSSGTPARYRPHRRPADARPPRQHPLRVAHLGPRRHGSDAPRGGSHAAGRQCGGPTPRWCAVGPTENAGAGTFPERAEPAVVPAGDRRAPAELRRLRAPAPRSLRSHGTSARRLLRSEPLL